MKLVDTTVCVVCDKREYSLSKGKSSRQFSGVCDECVKDLGDHFDHATLVSLPKERFNASKENGSKTQSESVSKRSQSS